MEANELCTRRQFARWLIKLNSSLERLVPVHHSSTLLSINLERKHVGLRGFHLKWVSLSSRNPKHRIAPLVSLSGSADNAFDDISVDDPDFQSIQGNKSYGISLEPKIKFLLGRDLNDL